MADATNVSSEPFDREDRLLLEALVEDGRASHRDLATRTGISLATVNRRVHRLENSGVIRGYHALLSAEAAGWGVTAIIGVRIDKGHIRKVQQAVAQDPRIFGVYDVTGEWDSIVLARVRDRADLDDLAKGTMSSPHIQRTNTMFVLATVLERALVGVPPEARAKGKAAATHTA